MANLNIVVSVVEGKKKEERKLTSFVIGESIVRSELTSLSKDARQAKIREFAKHFLTAEQQALEFVCTAAAEQTEQVEAPTPEAAPAAPETEVAGEPTA